MRLSISRIWSMDAVAATCPLHSISHALPFVSWLLRRNGKTSDPNNRTKASTNKIIMNEWDHRYQPVEPFDNKAITEYSWHTRHTTPLAQRMDKYESVKIAGKFSSTKKQQNSKTFERDFQCQHFVTHFFGVFFSLAGFDWRTTNLKKNSVAEGEKMKRYSNLEKV